MFGDSSTFEGAWECHMLSLCLVCQWVVLQWDVVTSVPLLSGALVCESPWSQLCVLRQKGSALALTPTWAFCFFSNFICSLCEGRIYVPSVYAEEGRPLSLCRMGNGQPHTAETMQWKERVLLCEHPGKKTWFSHEGKMMSMRGIWEKFPIGKSI